MRNYARRTQWLVAWIAAVISNAGVDRAVAATADEFLGSWAFELPDGNPAWLRLATQGDGFRGSMLWSVGSARPLRDIAFRDGAMIFSRSIRWQPYGDRDSRKQISTPFEARLGDDGHLRLKVVQSDIGANDGKAETYELIGKRLPPLPPRPDLSSIRFGPSVPLFDGKSLEGWELSNPKKKNGWRAEDGTLVNETPKTDFGAYGAYGNLRTQRVFHDFELSIDYNVTAGGNSGVYLRGMYEAQVVDRDSSMQGINGPGAIFGRIAPSRNAARPGGEWNQYVLTLVDRHITVVLNGETVIDNRPILGCTGGGLSADVTKPGPIFLQGDHTSVEYRNIRIRERLPAD